MSSSRKSDIVVRLAAILAVPVFYILSFGPACGLVGTGILPVALVATVYDPCIQILVSEQTGQIGERLYDWVALCRGEVMLARIAWELAPNRGVTASNVLAE